MEVTLRILDLFFYEGPDVFFPIALALFKLNESPILKGLDGPSVLQKLKEAVYDPDVLLEVYF